MGERKGNSEYFFIHVKSLSKAYTSRIQEKAVRVRSGTEKAKGKDMNRIIMTGIGIINLMA